MSRQAFIEGNGAGKANLSDVEVPEDRTLRERAEKVAQIGNWQWCPETDELVWSESLFRLFGIEPQVPAPSRQWVLEHTHPEDRERMEKAVQSLDRDSRLPPVQYRYLHPRGVVRHFRSTVTAVERGGQGRRAIVGVVQDVTERYGAERAVAAHVAAARALEEWKAFEPGAERLLRSLGEAMDCEVGIFWIPVDDELVARASWSAPSVPVEELRSMTEGLRFPRGRGLPGAVWQKAEPIGWHDVLNDRQHLRPAAATAAGFHGALAFPALRGEQVLAVLEFYYRQEAEPIPRLMRTTTAIGYQLGRFLNRRRGELEPCTLTPRELEVLGLAAQGQTCPEIAQALVLAPSTVKTHLQHIYEKLGVPDRASAVAHALRRGLIE